MPLDIISIIALLLLAFPLIGFLLLQSVGKKLAGGGDWSAIVIMGSCTALSSYILYDVWLLGNTYQSSFNWAGQFNMGLLIDQKSALMLLIISLVSLLVQVFSTSYMKGDAQYTRYFSYLQFFTFSMFGLVLVNNLIGIYLFWELVGLSSYLLIGFWQHKPSANRASKKAFLLNRIGDAGFLIGIGAIFALYGQLEVQELQNMAASTEYQGLQWLAGFGLLCGAIGKSAQFPLSIWLPDAMEGPTPVSALIHAATMVAAGVYLLARFSFLLTPDVRLIAALIGAITAFMAAFSAITQTDIKKVLAYSTVSQLGYMVLAIGADAPELAMFHLLTHACFKACLFLSAGAIIHALHEAGHAAHHDFDAQDMRLMGGLRKKLPVTFWAFTLSGLSLAGLPFFSGFLSKDAILIAVADQAALGNTIFYFCLFLGMLAALFTAFYVGRMLWEVFFGKFRNPQIESHIQENPLAIRLPLMVLSALSIWLFYSFNPFSASASWVLGNQTNTHNNLHVMVELGSIALAIGGLLAAYFLYRKSNSGASTIQVKTGSFLHRLSYNFWYLDVLYAKMVRFIVILPTRLLAIFDKKWIDGIVHWLGLTVTVLGHVLAWLDRALIDGTVHFVTGLANRAGNSTRSIQGGQIQSYFIWGLIGLFALIFFLVL